MPLIRTPRDVANTVRGRRRDLRMSQRELAERAGVSRKWIYEFEAGKPGAELGILIAVLEALGLRLGVEMKPESDRDVEGVDLDALLEAYKKP